MTEQADSSTGPARKYLRCPCGELIEAETEDELVDRARAHLAAEHPGHEYSRDEILFLAY